MKYPERVKIVGNILPDGVKELITKNHLILVPSLAEGLPNLIVESCAIGRVVLASNVNGIPEVIENMKTGYILPPLDSELWFDKIKFAFDNMELFGTFGRNAREKIELEFNAANFENNFFNKIEKLVK